MMTFNDLKAYVFAEKDSYPMNFGFSTERNFVGYSNKIMLLLYTVAVLRVIRPRASPTLQ
jgi:hypothetical protein